jgi:3-oxoacyl-[acyl-carrier protein] reductase
MGELTGKACLVTGGSRGIGRAIALELGRQGASVAVGYVTNKAAAAKVAAEIATSGGQSFAFGCDVQDPDAIEPAIAGVLDRFGNCL